LAPVGPLLVATSIISTTSPNAAASFKTTEVPLDAVYSLELKRIPFKNTST
jgi:hypothetical protein